jgi:hypothetical protein
VKAVTESPRYKHWSMSQTGTIMMPTDQPTDAATIKKDNKYLMN